MRSLIKLAFVLFIGFVAVGFYLGWFSLSKTKPEPNDDKVNINVSVDKAKMKSDFQKAEGKVEELGGGSKSKKTEPSGK